MIFADDMNSYFGGPQHNSASTNPLDMAAATWKPPGPGHSADMIPGSGYDGSGSKLAKWGHPMPVDYSKNGGHHETQQVLNQQPAPFTPGLHMQSAGFPAWNEPSFQFTHQPPQQDQHLQQTEAKFSGLNLKANVFHPSLPPQGPPGHFTPPVEMVNGQWGRAEINQTTPWNVEMNGMTTNDSTPPQQQSQQRYRKWEQQPRDIDGCAFNPVAFPGPAPYGMHGGYGSGNDRMIPGGGGPFAPPQFAPNRVPPQRWDGGMGGPASGKFGGGEVGGAGMNMIQQQRGSNGPTGLFTSGPPPPLHSMGMPPRPNHILGGHMPPPPLLPSLNPHMGGAQFNVNQFVPMDIQQQPNLSEDSVWQDPNGDLRKWQKDTGTSIWGDPAKQTNVPIQRWLQFTADEVVAKSSILSKDGEMVDGGWGDLPPIGTSTALANNNNTNVVNSNNNNVRSGGANQFVIPHHSQSSQQPQQQSSNKNNRQINSNNNWGHENQQISGTQAWERHEQQQNIPMHQQNMNPLTNSNNQFQNPTAGTVAGSTGNFMLPTTTTAAQSQHSMFQPPSLLSSLIDPLTGANETDHQHHQQTGQSGQRKTASPPSTIGLGPASSQQAPQQTKVSLAEELSSLGGTHGLGGPIW